MIPKGIHGAEGWEGSVPPHTAVFLRIGGLWLNPYCSINNTEGQSLRASCPEGADRDWFAARIVAVFMCCAARAGEELRQGQRPPERVAVGGGCVAAGA